jgi:hypothetical protein
MGRAQELTAIGNVADCGWSARSPDGRLCVGLRRCAGGLYLERRQLLDVGGRIVQGLMFMTEEEFLGWCDVDDARFAYPLMCSNVRRAGCDLFRRIPGVTQPPGSLRVA